MALQDERQQQEEEQEQQLPERKETGEIANPKRTQVGNAGEALREEPPTSGQQQESGRGSEDPRYAAEESCDVTEETPGESGST